MSAVADSDRQSAGLLSLWYNREARQVIIQIFTIAVVFAAVFYLARNAAINLERIGKDLGFAFLLEPSSYDINQTFIEYSSRSSHLRAAVVGVMNTFAVAVCGVFLATIVGFVLGVLRLSKNLLMNKMVYC